MDKLKRLFSKILPHKILWRVLTIVFILLSSFVFALSGICNLYAPVINQALGIQTSTSSGGEASADTYYYKSSYSTLNELYQDKVALLREIGQEGTVVVKNTGETLPVKEGKIAVLGEDKGFIYETTTAGGTIKIDHSLCSSLSDGLKLNNKTVTTSLDGLTANDTAIVIIGRAAGEAIDMDKEKLQLTEAEKSLLNGAISSPAKVVLLISGDFNVECRDYINNSGVGAVVRFGNAGYRSAIGLADVIVGKVSPSGKLVETMAADLSSAPANINFGDFTYANASQLRLGFTKNYLIYQEGVYVDYKYYETRYEDGVLGKGNASSAVGTYKSTDGWKYSEEVCYPFGYGLSYTTFDKEIVGEPVYNAEDDTWSISVKVTNTGNVPGKEVVQVYAQAPYTSYDIANKVEKSSVMLMGFEKTDEIGTEEGNNSQTVTVKIHQQWLASYDSIGARGYIMDAGDYYLSIGNGSHEAINNILAAKGKTVDDGMDFAGDANLAVKITPAISAQATETSPDTEMYKTIYTDKRVTNSFDDVDVNSFLAEGDKVTYLSRSDWQKTYPTKVELTASKSMISSLNEKKKMDNNVIDTASRVQTKDNLKYVDKANYVSSETVIKMHGKAYGDAGWDAILDNMSIYDMSFMVSNGRYSIPAAKSVSFPEMPGNDNPTGLWVQYKYGAIDKITGKKTAIEDNATLTDSITGDKVNVKDLWASMFASEPVLGATFSHELAARQGDMFAEDALYCGQTFVWGLGVNIHRTAYGGRASEYFSADPIHSTLLASDWNTASCKKGCIMVAKHLAANEQEVNRYGVGTFMTEQTFREEYLRAFEGITVYGGMKGVMASYNRVGLISAAAEYDLMTGVLREEWGFDGYAITDLYSITEGLYVGKEMVMAGTDIMLGTGYDNEKGTYVQTSLNVENIKKDAKLLTAVRESCHRMMYAFVNSNGVNGVSVNTRISDAIPFYIPLIISLEVIFTIVAVCSAALYIAGNVNLKKSENGEADGNE